MNQKQKNLAKIAVEIGVNLQPGQNLYINSPIETADFARELSQAAFDAGAKDVQIFYADEQFAKIRYENASCEALAEVPESYKIRYQEILDKDGAVISIHASDPNLLTDVAPEKIMANVRAREEATQEYSDAVMADQIRWCVVSVPTDSWAKSVFPDDEDSVDHLWDAILSSTYCDQDDPVACWREKDKTFNSRAKRLNDKQYRALRYKNARGTDITVGMPKNHIWSGGSEAAQDGISFFPNLPTEEIFSAPNCDEVNGTLVSAYPLVYQGRTIDNFSITFKDGKAVSWQAETGADALDDLIHASDGSDRLGEIALVPHDSAISNMNLLFYNTLFDENAACHFALGAAYPGCVENGENLTREELQAIGLNQSPTHVDFMVGTDDLEIVGITEDGQEEAIFEQGNFVF